LIYLKENALKNSIAEIQNRINLKQISRATTLLVAFVRPALFLCVQALVILLFISLNCKSPVLSVSSWWTVYGTVVDACCLITLYYLLRKERLHITDLISFDKSKVKNDLLIGLCIILLVFPLTMFIGSLLGSFSVYGSFQPDLPAGNPLTRALPLWAAIYSKAIWWVISAPTEELIYQGYVLPRLQVFFGKKIPAVLWVGFAWALQHSFLPFINLKYALFAFLLFFPLAIAMQVIYLRVKRLFPLIIGHWGMDFISAVFMIAVK
jgi:membrane protease YdiL (CAAX protease family)